MFALKGDCLRPGSAVEMVNITSLAALASEASWEVMRWGSLGVVHAAGRSGAAVCLVHMS